jgi:hypothetical protein
MKYCNSIQEYGQYLYDACIAQGKAKDVCNSGKGGTKNHVVHADPDGFSLTYSSNNLEAVSQTYLGNNTKVSKAPPQNSPTHIEIVEGETWSETIHKYDKNVYANKTVVNNSTDFSVSADASYGEASVSANYEQVYSEEDTNISEEVSKETSAYTLSFQGIPGKHYAVDFYTTKYTCSDQPVLDVTYNFSTITFRAECDYSDGMALHWNNEHYHKTYDIASLGLDPVVVIPQTIVFDVNYDNPWPSYVITYITDVPAS